MKKMICFFKSLSARQIVISVLVILCLLLWVGLTLFSEGKKRGLQDQTAAFRWSEEKDSAQISCFFTEDVEVDKNKILEFRHGLDTLLKEASITAPKETARLWVDAYSAQGSITMSSDTDTLEAKAVGIGGDFFFFHPLQLLYGSYFSGEDLMQDKVILDEDAAWKLFGSNDIVGMEVSIGGIPHYISGVIKRADSHFHSAAGLQETLVYVSFETLSELGSTSGINTYEVVMPNPVKDFAYTNVKQKLGMNENSMWVVENSSRYGLEGLLTVISEFGIRSMNAHAIRYPYWEKVARGWEDVFALLLVLQILSLLIPITIVSVESVRLWRKKSWSLKTVCCFLADCRDRLVERFRGEKNKWKHF
ncbi:MAG: ABC transporter permease [Lachnospiraceae bacterium]|nr:ABC transporter permease [Lachnospiraceae bacterium]